MCAKAVILKMELLDASISITYKLEMCIQDLAQPPESELLGASLTVCFNKPSWLF